MKKNDITDDLIRDFIRWLSQQRKVNKTKKIGVAVIQRDLRYTQKTITAYVGRLSSFCNKFFSRKDDLPIKERSPIRRMAQNIEASMMCCCMCESFQEPDEMLKEEEIRLLVRVFLQYKAKLNEKTLDKRFFKGHLFEQMVIYLSQKKFGIRYQEVIKLFFEFLESTNWNNNKTLYDQIKNNLNSVRDECEVNIKYGFIEATEITPAAIIPKAGQSGITIKTLTKIFNCDRRTIYRMLKEGKIPCCHHRRGSVNVFELNKYLRATHTGLSNKDKRGIKFTSHQERELVGYCESMLDYVNKLGTINKTLPIEQQQKEKRKIIDQINARLVEYEEEVENKRSCWKTAKEAKEATGKELWTIHRYGRSGKIPSTQHFLRKIHYFVPDK